MLPLPPSLEELEQLRKQGKLKKESRPLTRAEQAAQHMKPPKAPHLETKKKSEALCRRQMQKLGADIRKAADDERILGSGITVRISKDVDFVGSIPLRVNGVVHATPLRVESKGITLKTRYKYGEDGQRIARHTGSFPLKNLSDKERIYLTTNRRNGGLSVVHLAFWTRDESLTIERVFLVGWKDWPGIERQLQQIAEEDGRFSGKSLRFHKDLHLLDGTEVQKISGQWQLEPNHWLKQWLPDDDTQLILF
jgi:hypothetical protein